MSKKGKRIDDKQLSLFDYDARIDEYASLKSKIIEQAHEVKKAAHSWEEDCIEIAAAVKRSIKKSGMSREQLLDAINKFYGIDSAGKKARPVSIHMFNHFLSKPTEYPIPSYLIFAIQRITKSLEPCRAFADAEDAQVISGDEVRQMKIGKLDDALGQIQRLKRELKGRV